MKMNIYFPGGRKVYADFHNYTHKTDQPVEAGGEGTAPQPFDLFLASMGTCAGIYVLRFCQKRGIDTTGLEIIQTTESDPLTNLISMVNINIKLPSGFPEKYKSAIIKSAELCKVKMNLDKPPEFDVSCEEM